MEQKRTRKEIYDELVRCVHDPVYFIDNYARIQHPIRGLIPFKTYPYQQDAVKGFIDHRYNIVLKGRQLGFTTIAAAYIAWFVLFHKDKNVVIVATKGDVSKNMIRIVKNIIKYVPKYMRLTKDVVKNVKSIELTNGSRVTAHATAEDVGRSEAVSLLVMDEVAHIANMDEIWTSIGPTVSAGGRVIMLSTPNGTDNWFAQEYQAASERKSNFNHRFGRYVNPNDPNDVVDDRFPWWVHPEHDLAWFENETRNIPPRKIAQEYLCVFNASGDTFLLGETIEALEARKVVPIERSHIDRCFWVWKIPEKGAKYLIAVDVARGDADPNRDFSAFHVIRIDGPKLEQCAEYKGKITPDFLGALVVEAAKKYNMAIVAPENNSGWSGQTIQRIQELRYPFLYYPPKNRNGVMMDQYSAEIHKILPGYTVTTANRLPMLAKMEEYIRSEGILLYSERLIMEFKTFIWNGGRPAAQRNRHDDLILSLAGAIWVREEAFMYLHRNADMAVALIEGMTRSNKTTGNFKDFNWKSNNMHDRARIAHHLENQNKIIMGNGDSVDLTWLYPTKKKV